MLPIRSTLALAPLAAWLAAGTALGQSENAAVERGRYVFRAAGGCSCHRDPGATDSSLSGGRAIETPFGTIYGTNITPDRETGIGAWTDEDFLRAMTRGVAPDGKDYYPVFPYPAFTKMKRADLLDLKAYLFSLEPVSKENEEPAMGFPFSIRASVKAWKLVNFDEGTFEPDPDESETWNRGAYLATALSHCRECHTPRTTTGGLDTDMDYAGSTDGPEGELAPNITPDERTGIGSWATPDIIWFLQTGFKPDGDDAQGLMGEVITQGYQYLTEPDLQSIAEYLKSLKPIEHEVEPPEQD